MIFRVDAAAALASPDNAEVLSAGPKTNEVLATFAELAEADKSPMTPERFKAIMNEVKAKIEV